MMLFTEFVVYIPITSIIIAVSFNKVQFLILISIFTFIIIIYIITTIAIITTTIYMTLIIIILTLLFLLFLIIIIIIITKIIIIITKIIIITSIITIITASIIIITTPYCVIQSFTFIIDLKDCWKKILNNENNTTILNEKFYSDLFCIFCLLLLFQIHPKRIFHFYFIHDSS